MANGVRSAELGGEGRARKGQILQMGSYKNLHVSVTEVTL